MSLLKQVIIKKRQINELFLKSKPKFNACNNKKYKIKVIKDSAVYAKKIKKHLSGLYYLVS